MYKFLVSASFLATALAQGGYGGGGSSYGQSGSSGMSGGYGSGGSGGSGGSYGSGGSGGSYGSGGSGGGYMAPSMTMASPMMETSPCSSGSMAMHTVLGGGSGGLVSTPSQIYANVGDKVKFVFLSKNHTATQSTFNAPCAKMAGGMDSGFHANKAMTPDSSSPSWEYTVKDMTPTWWYCRQTGHCGMGMVFAINPTAQKTFNQFQMMAKQSGGSMGGSYGSGGSSMSGGSYSMPPPPPAMSQSPPSPAYSMASGNGGGSSGGECQCSCFCGTAAWPAGYGVGAMGGMPGYLPMSQAPSLASQPMPTGQPAMSQGGSYGSPAMSQGGGYAAPAMSSPAMSAGGSYGSGGSGSSGGY